MSGYMPMAGYTKRCKNKQCIEYNRPFWSPLDVCFTCGQKVEEEIPA